MSSDNIVHAAHDLEDGCSCCLSTKLAIGALLITCLLFKFKNPLQYYIKFSIYVAIVMTFSIVMIPFGFLRPRNSKNVEIVGNILSFLFRIFEIDYSIENEKYFQMNKPYIIVCNHQSSLDFMTMMKIWPGGNCTPLAKKELLYSGPFGLAIWLCGITFIDRLNPQRARGTIDKLAQTINDENMRVWIYPEGTRNCKTELIPFKKGAFHLAIQAQIPIICVVTSSYMNFYSKKEKKFLSGKVKVRVLPPFQTRGMDLESVNQLTKHLQDKMQKEFELLNKEINLEEKYYTVFETKQANNETLLADKGDQTQDFSRLNFIQDLDSQIEISNLHLTSQLLNDSNNNSINDDETKKQN